MSGADLASWTGLDGVGALAAHCLIALVGAAGLLLVSWATETATFHALRWLECQGVIERLLPDVDSPNDSCDYRLQTAWTFLASSWAVLLVVLHPAVLGPLRATARPHFDLTEIAITCWVGVALHDAWFFALHTMLHQVKWLYRNVHITHHRPPNTAALNVFSTADMDAAEAVVLVFAFYAAHLVWSALHGGTWNPMAYMALILLEANMNMMGAAHAKTHLIHHLDPRVNRALFFSWWDRASGTWRDTHPAIRELSREEWWEYETRGLHALWRCARSALSRLRSKAA